MCEAGAAQAREARPAQGRAVATDRAPEAQGSCEGVQEFYTGALVLSYSAMFHAARALLFRDGWTEKSHACVVAYLRARYVSRGKLERRYLAMLDAARLERHETLYGLEVTVAREDAELTLRAAREFVSRVAKLIS